MKWFLTGSFYGVCLFGVLRAADPAVELYNQGANALAANNFDLAAQTFDKIITGYPSTPNIDDVRLRAGFAYLHANKFDLAIDRLSREAAANAKPEFRGTALYYTGMAQFYKAQGVVDKNTAKNAFKQSADTLATLINFIPSAPTPENNDLAEDAMYYRALAEFEAEDFNNAEAHLQQLISAYSGSLKRPDYLLTLGSLYADETNRAITAKQPESAVRALADKSLQAFDQVSSDPNALVQANEANMNKAEALNFLAQFDVSPDNPQRTVNAYQKVIDAYRLVHRKADMITIQEDRVKQLKAQSAAALQSGGGASLANGNSRLIQREEGRLADLNNEPDPVIQALIRIGECYAVMRQPDEARTVLRRVSHAKLTDTQQKEVDFQILYSYVLGGQTDKANAALTDYLAKHVGDPLADSISYQIAAKLLERKDYAGALEQAKRSLQDFPKGKFAARAVSLEAQALARLGRNDEAERVVDDFLHQNPDSPVANEMFLTEAQNKTARGDLNGALSDYQKIKDNNSAGPALQSAADAGYIQTLNSLRRYDDVIAESKVFASKYASSPALPSVLLFAGMALDQKHDPAAVAQLQSVAKQFPKDDASPFALSYIINIYQRANNVPAMIQAANDLRTAYPQAYQFLAQAADAVSAVSIKQKKFDDAIALYKPLIDAPKPDVAAAARNKIGDIWLLATKALGYYQSMALPARAEAEKRLSAGEQSYLSTLKDFPDQLEAIDGAFDGLTSALKQRRSWGVLKDADMEAYLGKLGEGLTSPDMPSRFELAKAGLVFVRKDGAAHYPEALDRFRKTVAANPGLKLTRGEANNYGALLIPAKDYQTAEGVYTDMLQNAAPNDQVTLADAYYGLGSIYLAQDNVTKAADYFSKMIAQPGGDAWHPHIQEVHFALALAAEQNGDPNGLALQTYSQLMQAPQGGVVLQAKAMLGYGRLLEKAGHGVSPATPGTIEFAVHYYQEPHTLFGPAAPSASAEGLYDAGKAYEKAGDKANAKKQYDDLLQNYGAIVSDWADKAKAAEQQLGP